MKGAAKRVGLEILGWTLLLLGVAALVLPGPGLILLALGLAVLSQQYDWAERRLEPVRLRALRAAAQGVATWPRIAGSVLAAVATVGFGVLWVLRPPAPSWWPVSDFWWLPGGLWAGLTVIGSAAIALVLVGYAYRRFHGRPEALQQLDRAIARADEEAGREKDEHRA